MRKLNYFLYVLSAIGMTMAIFACSDKEEPYEIDYVPSELPFVEYSIPVSRSAALIEKKLYRLSSIEEFNNIFGDFEGLEEIDFGKYELLFVKGKSPFAIREIYPQFEGVEETLDFTFRILIELKDDSDEPEDDDHTEVLDWNCAILIDILPENSRLSFSIYNK